MRAPYTPGRGMAVPLALAMALIGGSANAAEPLVQAARVAADFDEPHVVVLDLRPAAAFPGGPHSGGHILPTIAPPDGRFPGSAGADRGFCRRWGGWRRRSARSAWAMTPGGDRRQGFSGGGPGLLDLQGARARCGVGAGWRLGRLDRSGGARSGPTAPSHLHPALDAALRAELPEVTAARGGWQREAGRCPATGAVAGNREITRCARLCHLPARCGWTSAPRWRRTAG